jgi:hypothetical protein
MSDRITFSCSDCFGKLAVPSSAAGKKIRCPKCQGVATVPAAIFSPFEDMPAVPKRKTSEPQRAARDAANGRAENVRRQKRKREEPSENAWLDEDLSRNQGDDLWDGYGNGAGISQALPPRTKKKRPETSDRPILRGNGYEAPPPARSYGSGVSAGPMVAGILMMVGAAVWFFAGLAAGVIFFYPPVLFVLGIISFFKGLFGSD